MSLEAQNRHEVKKHKPTVSLSLGALEGATQSATPPLPGMPFLLQAFSSTHGVSLSVLIGRYQWRPFPLGDPQDTLCAPIGCLSVYPST